MGKKNKSAMRGSVVGAVIDTVLSTVAPGVVTVDTVAPMATGDIAPITIEQPTVTAPVVNDTVALVPDAQHVSTPVVNRLVAIARTARATEATGEVYCVTGQQRAFAVMLRKLCIARTGNEAMGNSLAAKLCVHAFGYSVQKGREALGETSASGMTRYMGYARKQGNAYYAKMHDKCDAVAHKVQRLFDVHARSEGYTGDVQTVTSDKPQA